MKSFYFVAALTALCGVEASNSTVTCHGCPGSTSTNDLVTRSDAPTTPCTAPPLTTIPAMTTSVVTTTKVYTITSCPASVTDCPVGQTTSEVTSYTTICPVSPTGGATGTESLPVESSMPAGGMASSTLITVAPITSPQSMPTGGAGTGGGSGSGSGNGTMPTAVPTAGASQLVGGITGVISLFVAALLL